MIQIITYSERYKADFIRLNRQWIETRFRLEQSDLDTFAHIDDNIIGHGGQIFLAIDESRQVVGCCALKPHPESDCHELAKMAVSPDAQGKGIGRPPLVNTVYDDSRTWHIWESLQGVNAGYWVINEDSEVMGGCGFYPTEGLPEGYVELVKFYLSPKVRGKGYGSKLFSLVINEARKAGYTHLYIESFPLA